MLLCDNVFNMKRQKRLIILKHATVFASVSSTFSDQSSSCEVNRHVELFRRSGDHGPGFRLQDADKVDGP